MIVFKIAFLFLAILWTGRLTIRLISNSAYKPDMIVKPILAGDIILWATGVVGFITCQWVL